MNKWTFFFLTLVLSTVTFAKDPIPSAKEVLTSMTKIYSEVEFMKSDYSKTEESLLLGTKEKTTGDLEFSRGKIRIDQKGKDKSTFIKGVKKFWYIQNKNEVTTGLIKKSVPSVFELIFTDQSVWNRFGSKYSDVPSKVYKIDVDTKSKLSNIKNLKLKINREKNTLVELEYMDEVNNKVLIAFSSTRFLRKAPKGRFSYKPKKADKVNQL